MTTIRRWTHDRRRWVWAVVGLMALGLVAATAVALIRDSGEQTDVVQDDPAGSSTTSTPTTVASTTTVAPTSTSTPAVTTTPPAPTPPPAAGPVPGAVTVIRGGPGGSGEIVVQWDAIAGATGYRVLRSDAAGGPYAVVADFDVTTGRATAAVDGVTVWSSQHSYLPTSAGSVARGSRRSTTSRCCAALADGPCRGTSVVLAAWHGLSPGVIRRVECPEPTARPDGHDGCRSQGHSALVGGRATAPR